jgi:SSS family solute:Na+ symporter
MTFLTGRHGRLAALAFSIAILVRLFNEVWSNTAVVGGYYGPAGSAEFIGAAMLFTAATLFYSLKGGLRSSIYTDVLQTGLFVLFFAVVLLLVLPEHGPVAADEHRRFPARCRRRPAAGRGAADPVLPLS